MALVPFVADRHPRGWHGRFAGGIGSSGHAHAMRMPRREGPHPAKKLHAVVPILHRGMAIRPGTIRPPAGV